MTHITKRDGIESAMSVAEDISAGRLDPAALDAKVTTACRELFGIVGSGPSDPLWELHGDVCRQYLGAHAVSSSELREWVSVQARWEAAGDDDTG